MQVMGRKMRKEYFVVCEAGEKWAARESNPEPND
jgi:hypothetical protein